MSIKQILRINYINSGKPNCIEYKGCPGTLNTKSNI